MKSKKAFAELIPAIIGGVITTALLMALFVGFSGPFLNFMSDSEGIKNFNKFTSALSTACDSGVNTQTYLSVPGASKEYFVFSLVGPSTYKQIRDIPSPFKTPSDSIAALQKCEDKYCYCLLKLKNMCIPDSQNAIVKDITYFKPVNISYSIVSIYSGEKLDFNYYGKSNNMLAQGFTVSTEGVLTNVWIHGQMNDTSNVKDNTNIRVEIVSSDSSGNPDMNKILAFSIIPIEQLKIGGWMKLDFNYDQVTFDRDGKYFIVVSSKDNLDLNPFIWKGANYLGVTDTKNAGDAMTFDPTTSVWTIQTSMLNRQNMHLFDYAVEIKSLTSDTALKKWDKELADSFSVANMIKADNRDSGYVQQILVLQCRTIDSDMGCKSNDHYSYYIAPRLQSGSNDYILTWLQPTKIPFESFTAERPINSTGQYENYLSIHSTPDIVPNANANIYYGGPGLAPTLAECK